MTTPTPLAIDETFNLEINGSTQRMRICSTRAGLLPLLVVQGGPALPLLNEVAKFRRRLNLESDFLVCYWEQRGCGAAPLNDAKSVSLEQQVRDLRTVLRWTHEKTGQRIVLLGISIGGTLSLQAAQHERECCEAIIAISPDANTAASDAAAYDFLRQQALLPEHPGLAGRVKKIGEPPYVDSAPFQRRLRVLADLGRVESGRTFGALSRELLFSLVATYGVAGTVKTLRNMLVVQRRLLPDVASLDLFANTPRVTIPVHYVFGERDVLTPATLVHQLTAAVGAPATSVTLLPDAAHMAHFDRPDAVRSIALALLREGRGIPAA